MDNWHQRMRGWHKSSYTHYEENACVEVGATPGLIGVRDTKQHEQADDVRPVLVFTSTSFRVFLDHVAF